MADAARDANRIPTLIGVSEVDGITPTRVAVNPTTKRMLVDVAIDAGDLEIGAVEIKNSTDDTRATVGANGLYVDVRASALPTDAATQTTLSAINAKLVTGTDIGDVTINNSTGDAAVPIRDGGNAITVDGSVTLGSNTGVDIGKLTDNQSVNLTQLVGNTISSGIGTSGTGTLRAVIANDTGRTLVSTGGSAGTSGNNTLVAAGTNKLKVYAFSLSTVSTTAVTCIFQSGASGTELWRVVLQTPTSVAGGANLVVQPPAWLFATASATLLNLNLSAAVTVHWSVSYFDEA